MPLSNDHGYSLAVVGPFDTPGVGADDSYRAGVRYGRALGFRGKLCFSAAQVAIVNEEYREQELATPG